jgi:hypothetical protein
MSNNLLNSINIDKNLFNKYHFGIGVKNIYTRLGIFDNFLEIESKEIFNLLINYLEDKLLTKELSSYSKSENLSVISFTKFDLINLASHLKDEIINYSISIDSKDYISKLINICDEILESKNITVLEETIFLNNKDYISNLSVLIIVLFRLANNINFKKKKVFIYFNNQREKEREAV